MSLRAVSALALALVSTAVSAQEFTLDQVRAASERAGRIGNIMPFDLNEDLTVTPQEIETALGSSHWQRGANTNQTLGQALLHDLDRDGTISKEEIMRGRDRNPPATP